MKFLFFASACLAVSLWDELLMNLNYKEFNKLGNEIEDYLKLLLDSSRMDVKFGSSFDAIKNVWRTYYLHSNDFTPASLSTSLVTLKESIMVLNEGEDNDIIRSIDGFHLGESDLQTNRRALLAAKAKAYNYDLGQDAENYIEYISHAQGELQKIHDEFQKSELHKFAEHCERAAGFLNGIASKLKQGRMSPELAEMIINSSTSLEIVVPQ